MGAEPLTAALRRWLQARTSAIELIATVDRKHLSQLVEAMSAGLDGVAAGHGIGRYPRDRLAAGSQGASVPGGRGFHGDTASLGS